MSEVNSALTTVANYFKEKPEPKAECKLYTKEDLAKKSDSDLKTIGALGAFAFGSKECATLVKNELEKRGYKSGD
jgi:hypothetical protein